MNPVEFLPTKKPFYALSTYISFVSCSWTRVTYSGKEWVLQGGRSLICHRAYVRELRVRRWPSYSVCRGSESKPWKTEESIWNLVELGEATLDEWAGHYHRAPHKGGDSKGPITEGESRENEKETTCRFRLRRPRPAMHLGLWREAQRDKASIPVLQHPVMR